MDGQTAIRRISVRKQLLATATVILGMSVGNLAMADTPVYRHPIIERLPITGFLLIAPPTFVPAASAPTWSESGALTDGVYGQPYAVTIPCAAALGNGTMTYAVVGSLPAGLTFNAETITISGTPDFTGTQSFTLSATNAQGTTTATFSISAAPQ
jgi:hypothetical protein